jgi:hypothetical protein
MRVALAKPEIPRETGLDPAYPNPFNPDVRIRYRVAEESPVLLTVCDLRGRTVAVLNSEPAAAPGTRAVRWNGEDASGNAAPAGVYVFTLRAGSCVESRKALLVR